VRRERLTKAPLFFVPSIWSPIEPPGSIGSLSCQMRHPMRPIPTRTTTSKAIVTMESTSSQFMHLSASLKQGRQREPRVRVARLAA
jgi:hypothetical protein